MESLGLLLSIIMINIVLSGDNAVVIAMASRCLSADKQKKAILWGSAGAIVLRILFTFVVVLLLQIPYTQFIGGFVLVFVAVKLMMEETHCDQVEAAASLKQAVKMIIFADLIMSMDNTLAIAAVANGNIVLLYLGLLLSIPLIIFGSQLIIKIMDKYPLVVFAGAALIAWTAGEMMMNDKNIGPHILVYIPGWVIPALITVGVIGYGKWTRRNQITDKDSRDAHSHDPLKSVGK